MESGATQEILVILKDTDSHAPLPSLGSTYKTRQVISPRVFTVESTGAGLAALQERSDMTVVSGNNPLPESIDDLTESEQLFMAAWLSRWQKQEAKQRPGDGLSWDAPGFTPPDPPVT